MFSYYGSKSKIVDLYPSPKHGKIIEPFAGSARYSLKYFEREVLLVDKYPVIVEVWKYLQQASEKDILSLPSPKMGEKIRREDFDCIAQAWLMGFMVQGGVNAPRLTVSSSGNFGASIERDKKRIARDLFKIRHWEIRLGSYEDIPNEAATWFVDPPYQYGGEYYVKGNKDINYTDLAEWIRARLGQVIVCENSRADWLPFYPMRKMQGSKYETVESIWSNETHDFMARQIELFETV